MCSLVTYMLNVVSVNASFEYWPMEQTQTTGNEKNDRKNNRIKRRNNETRTTTINSTWKEQQQRQDNCPAITASRCARSLSLNAWCHNGCMGGTSGSQATAIVSSDAHELNENREFNFHSLFLNFHVCDKVTLFMRQSPLPSHHDYSVRIYFRYQVYWPPVQLCFARSWHKCDALIGSHKEQRARRRVWIVWNLFGSLVVRHQRTLCNEMETTS